MTDEETTKTPTDGNPTGTNAETVPPKTFTQDEVDKIVQDRLAQQKRKTEKESEDARRKAEEQASLEKLQGEERLKKQFELDKARLEQERDAFLRDLRLARAESMLASKGLDARFAPNMIGDSDEATRTNIDALEKLVNDMVATKTKEALGKGAPPAGNGTTTQNDLLNVARKAAGLQVK